MTFASIADDHVRQIAGMAVGGTALPARDRLALFKLYLDSARKLSPSPISDQDAAELLALFIHFGRKKTDKSRGGPINTWFGNRKAKPLINTV